MSEFKPNNCRLDLEDREMLTSLPYLPMKSAEWQAFSRPAEVDISWHQTENQGPIGSCQGHGLSSCLERIQIVLGVQIQLSEIFAYLATQKVDGLLGNDSGSTISGGGKVALRTGCCEESRTGYPRSYPRQVDRNKILSPENYEAAKKFAAKSLWNVTEDHDENLDFIGGGGAISFGISWYQGLIPRDRIVRVFRPSRPLGGHAMAALGYDRNGMIKAVNSHADGPYLITPEAWAAMKKHRNTAMVGMMGTKEAVPIDWYNNSPYFK